MSPGPHMALFRKEENQKIVVHLPEAAIPETSERSVIVYDPSRRGKRETMTGWVSGSMSTHPAGRWMRTRFLRCQVTELTQTSRC